MNRLSGFSKTLGPGLLWAGAAIGVSHLVQSTRAGASYGFGLVWAIVLANLFKYPFFEFGPRYAAATGESLLEGYQRMGNWALALFLTLTVGTMFTIQAAVTIVTAGLATQITTLPLSPLSWSAALLGICVVILIIGKYPLLDNTIKGIIVMLALSTVISVAAATLHRAYTPTITQRFTWDVTDISFLVALMGWMPSAIDIAVWHSLWTLEKRRQTGHAPTLRESLLDFNIGYLGTAVLALGFLALGALVMNGRGREFSPSGAVFAGQLVSLYTETLGTWSRPVIILAAFTTMFSTVLTVTDAFPRVLKRSTELVLPGLQKKVRGDTLYWAWMLIVVAGALFLLATLRKGMTFLVDLATTLSFLTAPVLAFINYRVVTGKHMPPGTTPPPWLRRLSWLGLMFLTAFGGLFLIWRFSSSS